MICSCPFLYVLYQTRKTNPFALAVAENAYTPPPPPAAGAFAAFQVDAARQGGRGPAKAKIPSSSGGDKKDRQVKYSTSYQTFGQLPVEAPESMIMNSPVMGSGSEGFFAGAEAQHVAEWIYTLSLQAAVAVTPVHRNGGDASRQTSDAAYLVLLPAMTQTIPSDEAQGITRSV